MKHLILTLRTTIALGLLLATSLTSQAATTFLWNVATPGANDWNVNANWTPSTGNPGSADTALFGATGTSANSTTINNVVSVNTAITALEFTNFVSGTWNVTQIPAGVTLSTSGNVIVGSALLTAPADGTVVSAAMNGGGTFAASGNNFLIGCWGNSTLDSGTILDLSGLSNFVYNASAGVIGMGISNRSTASLVLAATTNYITAGTINLDTGSSSSSGTAGNFKLGAGTNVLNVGAINIGANRTAGTMNFATTTGGLRLRGVAGGDGDRVTTVVLGNRNTGSSTGGTTTGTLAFNGHPVDAKIATLTMGQETSASNAGLIGVGNLQFDAGTIDVTTINMAIVTGNNSNNAATATLTVGANATLLVNSVSLANTTLTTNGISATGTLSVNGGTAICTNNIVKTGTLPINTGIVAVASSGTLFVQGKIGLPSNPVDFLNVTNATLQLNVDATGSITTNICVKTVNPSGTTTFNIANVLGVSVPTTFPLVSYAALNGTVVGNFTVAAPAGYLASLVDNSAQQRIDLSISPSVIIVPLVWSGATNGDWDTVTSNWLAAGALATYSDFTNVVFDDSASNSTVNLTATFSPASMVMSNSVLNYTFSGPGSLGGTNSLTLKGTATTVLDNSGSNSYTGGTLIGFGTLQIGNNDANGNLPGGTPVTDNSSLVYHRTDAVISDNPISGTGSLVQNGSGLLTLVGANAYGATTIGLGSGGLQVGAGGTSGSLGTGAVTDNASLTFDRSDNITIANSIGGSGSVTKINNNVLTLTGNNGFGGGLTVNAGILRLASTNAAGAAGNVITVNPNGTLVLVTTNVSVSRSIVLAGGTLGAQFSAGPSMPDQLTLAPATTSLLILGDPQNLNPSQADATEMNFTNTLHGSGSVVLISVNNDNTPDSGNGFRLRGTAASDFSGTLTVSNRVKCELQTIVTGPFSPAGTGKLVLYGGVLTNNTVNGTFAELNLRNNSPGSTAFGNDIEIAGTGLVVVDPLGSAPSTSTTTLGNLKIGAGQELGVNLNGTASPPTNHPVIFPTVTLNGGNATFSPKTSGWNTAPQWGSDLWLGTVSELSPGSGFTMSGLMSLVLVGNTANTYSGATTNANGTLVLNKTSGNAIPGLLVITGGTVTNAGNDQIADSASVIVQGGAWALGSSSETVGPVSLAGGTITGPGTLTGSSYDAQSGSVSAILAGSATLTKSTSGTVSLSAANAYTSPTLVNAGTLALTGSGSIADSASITVAAGAVLDVSGRVDGALTLSSGQALRGDGTIDGSLMGVAGSLVSPGASIGVLTVTNIATLACNTFLEIDAANGTNDQIVAGSLVYAGGSLVVTNLAGTLAAGQTFKLFSAPSYPATSFTSITLPALDPSLAWQTNLTVDGTIQVVLGGPTTNANITSVFLSGTNLVFGGTNNNGGQNFHYVVLSSSDVTQPLSNWTALSTNSFAPDGTFSVTNAIDPAQPQLFYDVKAVP